MARKRTHSKRGKTFFSRVVVLLCVAFAGVLCFSIISTQIDISEKKSELSALQVKTNELRILNEEYRSLLESCDTEGYIERIAREKLNYVYPEERVYIDRSGK